MSGGLVSVSKADGKAFFNACLSEMEQAGGKALPYLRRAKAIDVPQNLLPKARARLARSGKHDAPPMPVEITLSLHSRDGDHGVMAAVGFVVRESAHLAVCRRPLSDLDAGEFLIVHRASGLTVDLVSGADRSAALARAAAIEAACPAFAAFSPSDPASLERVRAEWAEFREREKA